ncbi:MAG: hypothetical protein P8P56_01165, partial [Yoonia sp.]|nr:hypothetical protein [Yoonia sp.]
SSRWRRTQASSSRRSAAERKPGQIIPVAESFHAKASRRQIRLPKDPEYINENFRIGAEFLQHEFTDFDGGGDDISAKTMSLRASYSF